MQRLDKESVLALEQKAPGACEKEARALQERVRSGEILSAFDQAERDIIWSKLLTASADCLIPSLRGFFDDLNYIMAAAPCMKRLVSLEGEQTIRCAFQLAYSNGDEDSNQFLIQSSESSFKLVETDKTNGFDIAYRQLWLNALRDHDYMPAERQRKKSGPKPQEADETALSQFVSLASKLGFSSDKIKVLLQRDPDRETARRLLMTARKPDQFEYEDLESCITEVAGVMARARRLEVHNDVDAFEVEIVNTKPPERAGLPNHWDLARERAFMYLPAFHGETYRRNTKNPELSSFFIIRSQYFSLFGKDLGFTMNALEERQEQLVIPGIMMLRRNVDGQFTEREAVLQRADEEYRVELENLRGNIGEAKSRLEIVEQEQQHKAKVEQLQSTITTLENTLLVLRREDKELQEKLPELRKTEAEQTIRLERLRHSEQQSQTQFAELERRRRNLGEEIRLELATTDFQDQNTEEEERKAELVHLSEQAIEKQNNLNQLTALSREKQLETQRIEEETQKQRNAVDELITRAQKLAEEEQAKNRSIEAVERTHRSVVDKLVAKELKLRENIDQLKACLQRLQRKINDATEDEREILARIENLSAVETTGEGTRSPTGVASARSDNHDGHATVIDGDGENEAWDNALQKRTQGERQVSRAGLATMVRKALDSDEESIEETFALGNEVTVEEQPVPIDGESDPPQVRLVTSMPFGSTNKPTKVTGQMVRSGSSDHRIQKVRKWGLECDK